MKLCSKKHEEVCYESSCCPVCDIRDDLQSIIESDKDDIKDLKRQIDDLEDR